MADTHVLRLTYITNTDEKVNYNIPRAKSGLTAPEAKNYMDAVKNLNIVITGKGMLYKSSSAELITTKTNDIPLQ